MPSISNRLKSLGVSVGTQKIQPPKPRQDEDYPIDKVLAGDFWHTPSGDIFVVETKYRSDFLRGSIKLKPSSSLDMIAAYARAPQIADFDIEQFAFMDTETTGLGLGTGVYTFMVGIGRFEGEHFRLAQFFLREPGEETAQLAAIEQFLSPCAAWVTFNGKSFDALIIQQTPFSPATLPTSCGSLWIVVVPKGTTASLNRLGVIWLLSICICESIKPGTRYALFRSSVCNAVILAGGSPSST